MDLIDSLTDGISDELADAARAVADAIEHCEGELDTAMKWGKVTYATGGDFHHWICALGTTKKAVGLTFHFGSLLEDPDGRLVAGSSKFLRKIEYSSADEVDRQEIVAFVSRALERYGFFKENWKDLR